MMEASTMAVYYSSTAASSKWTRHAHQLSSMKHFFRVKVPMMTAQRNPYVKKQLNASKRVDVVWDTYVAWSQPGRNEAKEYD